MLTAQLGNRHSALSLAQDRKDLGFVKSCHLHQNLLRYLAEKILVRIPLVLGRITPSVKFGRVKVGCIWRSTVAGGLEPVPHQRQLLGQMADKVSILGLHSRCVIGCAVSNRLKRTLAIRGLNMAIVFRAPPKAASTTLAAEANTVRAIIRRFCVNMASDLLR
jgi:hypothetical protein